ncbi:MAG: M16 family metallopeptidase [Thermomicrobiales bacterium]
MNRVELRAATETRLANGMKVILKEDLSATFVSLWTWYRVGSRNELPGKTGISHWVEHMQFKGTSQIAKGQIFSEVSRVGGTLNAMTSEDWTAYFETVPASDLDLPITIESDRMLNSIFAEDEVESERSVILSERQGAENNPGYALYEEVTGSAFHAHPYRHMEIGYEADLRQITRDDLYAHYRRFYHPANAFLVAVGDFATDDLIQRLETTFGALPAGGAIGRSIGVTEPPQPGERRVLLRQPAGAPYLRMAFHAPPAVHDDLVPLLVTEAVLSGGKPMGFGGGGGMGRSSRLYRSLVASGMARSAESDMSVSIDPNLFQIGVTALPGGDLQQIETIIDAELERLREALVPVHELERALRQLESQFVYSSEGVTNQAFWLGQWELVDDWRRAASFAEEIRGVSASDVQRVAQRYLVPERRTVGWLEPAPHGNGADSLTGHAPAFLGITAWGLDGPLAGGRDDSAAFQRAVLANDIPVLGQDRPGSRSVALRLRVPAGSIHELPAEDGIACLTARSLLRGSDGQTFDEINSRTDDLGSSIAVDAGREFVEARVRCLRDDFPELARLLAQTVLRPDFPQAEVEKVRAEQLGAIAEANNDTRATADRLMRRGAYPEPNPLGRRVLGTELSVAALDQNAVLGFHASVYSPSGSIVAVVGGLDGFDRAVEVLSEAFGSWEGTARTSQPANLSALSEAPFHDSEEIPGKSQADLALGLATLPRGHADYYALDLANLILGRLGLMGRLGAEVRDREGLAYYVFSQIEPRVDGSLWTARAGVDPGNVERALDAIKLELERLRSDLVTDEEIAAAKSHAIGVLPLTLESHDGVAATLLAIEHFGLGLDYLTRYPDIINGLTSEDLREAARKHLGPTRLAIGVARPA